jgi:pimeloyl-ACP methyl ester carboxylesterase
MTAIPNQLNAANEFVAAANGVRYAYRRLGEPTPGTTPLVFLQHFLGNIDNWDPALVDALAADREVILFDNTGVALTSGATPGTAAQMARDAIAFLDALGLDQVDLLGFSLGGFVAQEIALIRPRAVRKLVLAGTGPKGAPGMHGWPEDVADVALKLKLSAEDLLYIFFTPSEFSRGRGREFLGRIFSRTTDRDESASQVTRDAQYDAVTEWGIPDFPALQRLTGIQAPTLVIQGDADQMIPTNLSHLMAGLIPEARIKIYPESAHAFLFQYPAEVAGDVHGFLAE